MGGDNYIILFDVLYNTEFVWMDYVPMDENRAEDGVYLRAIFQQESGHDYGYTYESDSWPCSVLEMLIALARTMEDSILYDADKGDRTAEWFWLMLKNLKLDTYEDDLLISDRDSDFENIFEILHVFMNRLYGKNGLGGVFPMRRTDKDQREVELWYQANEYAEKYLL